MKYMYFKSPADLQWYWHLKARNGKIVAHGEGYTTKAMCLKGIRLVKRSFFSKIIQEA